MATLRDGVRTVPNEVKDVLDTAIDDAELAAFVNAASYRVDEIEAEAPTTSAGRLAAIEMWYAAHLATVRPILAASESQESYSVEYERETTYLQTARELDPTNVLDDEALSYIEFGTPDAKGIRD